MSWAARLDAVTPGTIGLEEEVLLLHPRTFAPLPAAARALETLPADRFGLELPAAQIELISRPHTTVADAAADLAGARALLAAATDGWARPAAAAVHPYAPAEAELNRGPRYAALEERYRGVARRQLVGALHVHVAVGGAGRTLAVYNALRGLLPEIAALAAAAPFHEGRDTGLASVRPVIGGQLPRQGVPPVIESWSAFDRELAWGRAAGVVDHPGHWWWELRPHHRHGTLELRVPDTQPTPRRTLGVARFAVALVRWLGERHDGGEPLPAPPSWRIAENRWSALRHGVTGTLADLRTGARVSTRERLLELAEAVAPYADGRLEETLTLIERNTALALADAGVVGACRVLAESFTEPLAG